MFNFNSFGSKAVNTVSDIVSDLQEKVDALRQLSADRKQAASEARYQAQNLQAEAEGHDKESAEAVSVADKIEALLK